MKIFRNIVKRLYYFLLGPVIRRMNYFEAAMLTHSTNMPLIADYRFRVLSGETVIAESDGLRYVCNNVTVYLNIANYGKAILDGDNVINFIKRNIKKGEIVIDVGANIGCISLEAGRRVGPTGKVYALEPEPRTFRALQENIHLNNFEEYVTAINAAAYSSDGEMTLLVYPNDYSGHNTLGSHVYGPDHVLPEQTLTVPTLTLDHFCSEHTILHIDLLKLDAEGAEPDILAGAQNILKKHIISVIIFEISSVPLSAMGHRAHEIIHPLIDCGYTIHQIDADGSVDIVPIKNVLKIVNTIIFGNLVALAPTMRNTQNNSGAKDY